MAWERDNAAEEFETMLRRHLMRSAGRSASCEGFDAERASAYVEEALSSAVRLGYEDHLAGCASCRRGIIELRRLMPEAEIVAAPVRTPGRIAEWWEGVRQGIAAAPWRWGTAAAAGAFAVLLAVVMIPGRRETAVPSGSIAMLSTPAPDATPGDTIVSGATAPAPQQTAGRTDLVRPVTTGQTGQTGQTAARQPVRERSGASLPVPPVMPMAVAVNGQSSIAGRNANPPGAAAAAAQAPMIAAAPAPPPAPAASGAGASKAEAEKAAGETVAENKPEAKSEARSDSRNQPARDAGTSAFVPRRQPRNSRRQSPPAPAAAAGDDETVQALTRKVRDKTFRYDNGRWIDAEFKPEFLPPRTRLDRNGADFERVLTENPELKPFFDLGRVIVVWKGKVYEVR